MKALRIKNKSISLKVVKKPQATENEALIKVLAAGIGAVDHDIIMGYKDFEGTFGHEFVGIVQECEISPELVGNRVVGEINSGCGYCELCRKDMGRHCAERDVLGISGRDGAFAEYLVLPAWNLHVVPDSIPTLSAVFTEPLAAALEIVEQVHLPPQTTVLIIGDGKLAQLIARVLRRISCRVEVVGRSEAKVKRMKDYLHKGYLNRQPPNVRYPFVIEASGSPRGWQVALDAVEPCGTIILKSAYAKKLDFNPAAIVTNELNIIGSRCGPFEPALDMLGSGLEVQELIDGEFSLDDWQDAFELFQKPDTIKLILKVSDA